jgi:hypothetical protein
MVDVNGDGQVDLKDCAKLISYWLDDTCIDPDWCDWSDINASGDVNWHDLKNLADYWLSECQW